MSPKTSRFWKKFARITMKVVAGLLLLCIVAVLSLHLPFVQRIVRNKAESFLEKKLGTEVNIGSIYIGLPDRIILDDIYVADKKNDTLLNAGRIRTNLNLWRLIFKSDVRFDGVQLEDVVANVARVNTDTVFNYQFIVDAFVPMDSVAISVDSMPTKPLHLGRVELDNIRLRYEDVVTGTRLNAQLQHLDARIDSINGDSLIFDIPTANVAGLNAVVQQTAPRARPVPGVVKPLPPLPTFLLGSGLLQDIHVDYKDDVLGINTDAHIGLLSIEPNRIDLNRQQIDLQELVLSNSKIRINSNPLKTIPLVKSDSIVMVKSLLGIGWDLRVKNLTLLNNEFIFDDASKRSIGSSVDFAHLGLTNFNLVAEDVLLNDDTASGKIIRAAVRDKSGFELQELQTDFQYTASGILLANLYLKTPGTILRDNASITYPSGGPGSNSANMRIDLDLDNSRVLVSDILAFAPALKKNPAFASPGETWYLDAGVHGILDDLQIDRLRLNGLSATKIDVAGRIKGLMDPKKLQADLDIRELTTTKSDLALFLPAGSMPKNISMPARYSINGDLKSNGTATTIANLRVNTDLGDASIRGRFSDIANATSAVYDATIESYSLNLGSLLQNPSIAGPVAATVRVSGKGFDPKTAAARFDGVVHRATIKNYTYSNARVGGSIENSIATVNTVINDANIDVDLDATINFASAFPSIEVSGMIDSIKFHELNLSKEEMIFRGRIDAHIPVSDPDHLQADVFLTQALFVQNGQRLNLDTVEFTAGENGDQNFITVRSDVLTANLNGSYELSQLPIIFQNAIQPYFNIMPVAQSAALAPYDFTLDINIADNPALKALVPGLQRMDSVYLRSHFADSGWTATIQGAAIDLNGSQIRNLSVIGNGDGRVMDLRASLGEFRSGKNILLLNTNFIATAANNNVDFALSSRDRRDVVKYRISGLLNQPTLNNYEFSLKPDSLLLNYDAWSVNQGNRIYVGPGKLQASNFVLSQGQQQLSINSRGAGSNAPVDIDFANFQLATLTGFVQTDSTLANGTMNGQVVLTDYRKPVFTTDLTVTDLSLKGDTIGNVRALVNNKTNGSLNTDITLTGRGNDARLTGTYVVSGSNNFDMVLDLNALPMTTLAALSDGAIRNASGNLTGDFTVRGNFSRPQINGDLNFNNAGFNFSMLNSYFSIENESVRINPDGIRFDRFEIRDSANNPMIIDGVVATNNFVNYKFDLDVRANNFRALNSTKRDNRLFYGQLYFNTDLRINGTESAPIVDGRLEINDKTKMTVVLPQREPGVVEREGIIEFIDADASINDSLFLAAYDSLNMSGFKGMDIAVNIVVVPEAEFSLIIDEGNGDFLNVRGDAALTAGIDPSGKVLLSGSYELVQGSYELTFNLLRRKFEIEKGSRIVWEGEPTDATVDVRAVYVANAAPLDLVKDQLGEVSSFTRNTYLQKLPFDVHLNMEGKLLQPQISFDIVLPENKNYGVGAEIVTNTRTRLEQLRLEEGELNKQVFSLLLLNRFVSENPFDAAGGGPTAGSLARQSVSRLLTEQLNNLAGDLIAGVDINFDVLASDDYTTGQRRDRTDLNVALSKRLLNDRLTVTVGSNFELEGPQNSNQASNIAGNVALDYRISRDNRYVLRAYRKNEYQGIIEGYVIETGVGFIINLDYNRFREIFLSKTEREQRRQRRQEQRKINAEQQSSTTVSDSTRARG